MQIIMSENSQTFNCVLRVALILLVYSPSGVLGSQFCVGNSKPDRFCNDNYHCCGIYNNECCIDDMPNINKGQEEIMELMSSFIVLMIFTFCCVCCYRCCCRRNTNRGFVYTTPGTTSVSVSMPPQHPMPPGQVPYPTVVPYPQQIPYPPQYNPPTNPYYGMPPPAYGIAIQSESQQSCAPTAPYMTS